MCSSMSPRNEIVAVEILAAGMRSRSEISAILPSRMRTEPETLRHSPRTILGVVQYQVRRTFQADFLTVRSCRADAASVLSNGKPGSASDKQRKIVYLDRLFENRLEEFAEDVIDLLPGPAPATGPVKRHVKTEVIEHIGVTPLFEITPLRNTHCLRIAPLRFPATLGGARNRSNATTISLANWFSFADGFFRNQSERNRQDLRSAASGISTGRMEDAKCIKADREFALLHPFGQMKGCFQRCMETITPRRLSQACVTSSCARLRICGGLSPAAR